MSYILFIDDERDPSYVGLTDKDNYKVARTSQAAIDMVKEFGVPNFIHFDHDLGWNEGTFDTTMRFLEWLILYDMDKNIISETILWAVHSMNPVGAENLDRKMYNYMTHKFGRRNV